MGCGASAPRHVDASLLAQTVRKLQDQMHACEKRGGAVDMRALTMLIWEAREHPELSDLVVGLLEINAADKNSFNGIEFYLPQLVHMIVHLEVKWETSTLEQFALFISQQSLHLALQVSWALVGLMQDYEAEDAEGKVNPKGNALLYNRCATLMEKLELSVVFGSPCAGELERLYAAGKINSFELAELEQADRRFQANFISAQVPDEGAYAHEGQLLYKRWKTRGIWHADRWIERRFVIGHRVLYCIRLSDGVVKRSIALHDCKVVVPEKRPGPGEKSEFYFELHEHESERVFMLRAKSQADLEGWVAALRSAIASPPLVPGARAASAMATAKLTPQQVARYGFYRSERDFIRLLTDYCEQLRFVEVPKRKEQLRAKLRETSVPGCVYNPLCGSTDPWMRLTRAVPEQSTAFSTRARCPCIMAFEVAPDDQQEDVASFLFQTLGFESHAALLTDADVALEPLSGGSNNGTSGADEDPTSAASSPRPLRAPSLGRQEFVRSARLSVHDLDKESIAGIRAGAGAGPAPAAPGSVEQPGAPRLWAHSTSAGMGGPAAAGADDAAQRQTLRAAALQLQAVQLLRSKSKDPDSKSPGKASEAHGAAPAPAAAATGSSSPSEPKRRGRYLAALGKYLEPQEQPAGAGPAQASRALADAAPPAPVTTTKLLAKSNDDLRQEVFIMQLIQFLDDIWRNAGLELKLTPYRIMSTAQRCGLVEVLIGSISIDGLKKDNGLCRVSKFFETKFTDPQALARARRMFTDSFAANSLMCYLLGVKDRHNGNLMLQLETGRLINIDFGFVFSMAPGKDKVPHTNFSMERAAFKITAELIEVMGGPESENYKHFNQLLVDGLLEARKYADTLIALIEIMGYKSKLPCFNQPGGGVLRVLRELRGRLMLDLSDAQAERKMRALSAAAATSWGTIWYEKFQKRSNGIEPVV
jgi:hypothetical protein